MRWSFITGVNRRWWILTALVGCLLLALVGLGMPEGDKPASKEPPPQTASEPATKGEKPADRGMQRRDAERQVGGYRRRLALIVGINYQGRPQSKDGQQVEPLKNAENDASSFAALLKSHYGYADKDIVLLLGKEATRKAILDHLEQDLAGKEVTTQDSVLVYFAGHGDERRNKEGQTVGEIVPYDVERQAGQNLASSTIKMSEELVAILRESKARHKLLILDCCHAAAIFAGGVRPREFHAVWPEESQFRTSGFQAIVSTRSVELAADGGQGHSPFTRALLDALRTIPRRLGTERPVLVNDLFRKMMMRMAAVHGKEHKDQRPDCRYLSVEEGEFHFFPKGDFSAFSDPADSALLLTMVPGVYGNWWFDEMPWFIPSLRAQILLRRETKRSKEPPITRRDDLRMTATRLALGLDSRSADHRSRHLSRLLEMERLRLPRRQIYEEIAAELTNLPEESVKANDLHLLAVMYLWLGSGEDDRDRAGVAFARALSAYAQEDQAQGFTSPLHSLCLADAGEYELRRGDHENAALRFGEAFDLFRTDLPPGYWIYLLCRQADALNGAGKRGQSEGLFQAAVKVAGDAALGDPQVKSLLAYARLRFAWGYVDQLKTDKAYEAFSQARQTLAELKSREESEDAQILDLHAQHGLALLRRYGGDPDGARSDFRKITQDISDTYRKLRDEQGGSLPERYDTQGRLVERIHNTYMRQAECSLFRERPDVREASSDLRRAIRACSRLPQSAREATLPLLLYRQVLTLAPAGKYQDLEFAEQYRNQADEIYKKLPPTQQKGLEWLRRLARCVLEVYQQRPEQQRGMPTEGLRKALAALREEITEQRGDYSRNLSRDQFEWLLYVSRLLVIESEGCESRWQRNQDAELLYVLTRTPVFQRNRAWQAYLRPYADTVLRAMIRTEPKHVQALQEAIWEITTATPWAKPEYPVPILMMYVLEEKTYLFLDAPPLGKNDAISELFVIEDEGTVDQMRRAVAGNSLLSLPTELRRHLVKLSAHLDGHRFLTEEPVAAVMTDKPSLWIHWHDPIQGLGRAPDTWLASRKGVAQRRSFSSAPVVSKFPFELPSGVATPKQ